MAIRVLPPQISDKIAAGEVIERPASVVKEMVENAIDAGATEIAVILQDGGRGLIEVIDNGSGMNAQDLALSIQRHATSKLQTLDDLERIRTLGFRGEALPSIAAVGSLQIVSRAISNENTYELNLDKSTTPELITFGHFLGSDHGTRMRVRNLFAQIPARLKFLKSPSAEMAYVRDWIEKLSITRPDIGFRLQNGDKKVLDLRPCTIEERIRQTLSEELQEKIVSESAESGSIRGRVYWLKGASTQQTRKMVQIVNGRVVRDRVIQQAIMNPFRQSFLPGRFPALVFSLDVDPADIDVNVHPTKTEIRFLESSGIFRVAQEIVEKLLEVKPGPAYEFKPIWRAAENSSVSSDFSVPATSATLATHAETDVSKPFEQLDMLPSIQRREHPLSNGLYLGILFRTYLLYDLGEELGLVDQHAAHERIRYERLKKQAFNGSETPRQDLLLPEVVQIRSDDRLIVERHLHLLEDLGFQTEIFGENAVLFRSIPQAWGNTGLNDRLKNLVERVIEIGDGSPNQDLLLDETLFEKLASEACHSSVRSGDELSSWEAQSLVDDLFGCEHPWNCPHGRPTVVQIPRGRLEEWFQRRL